MNIAANVNSNAFQRKPLGADVFVNLNALYADDAGRESLNAYSSKDFDAQLADDILAHESFHDAEFTYGPDAWRNLGASGNCEIRYPFQKESSTESERKALTDPALAPDLQHIVSDSTQSGIGPYELSHLAHEGFSISSGILGGPAGTSLHISEKEGQVSAQLDQPGQAPQELKVDAHALCIGNLATTLPDGRTVSIEKGDAELGLAMYVTDKNDHRVDLGFNNHGQAISAGSFSRVPGESYGNDGVRLDVTKAGTQLSIYSHRGEVSMEGHEQGLYASTTHYREDEHGLYWGDYDSLPDPSLAEMAAARDHALADLAADHFNFAP